MQNAQDHYHNDPEQSPDSGAFAGIVFALYSLQTAFAANDLRLGFTLFILCFVSVYLWTLYIQDGLPHHILSIRRVDYPLILLFGGLGGLISGILGSGADVLAFCMLALYFRIDIKLATQMSVIVMAATSIFGISTHILYLDGVDNTVTTLWYLAAPVVLCGAPLGAYFCRLIPSPYLVILVCSIVVVEVVSTVVLIPISPDKAGYFIVLTVLAVLTCYLLHRHGKAIRH